jgi:hypothetical protein
VAGLLRTIVLRATLRLLDLVIPLPGISFHSALIA